MENKNKKESKFKFVTLDENNNIIEDNSFLETVEVENNKSSEENELKNFENKSLKDLVDASLQKPRRVPSPEESKT